MIGQRIFPNKFGRLLLPEGGYGRDLHRQWWVRPPGSNAIKVDTPNVREHGDGTITVYTGINGYGSIIERGIWRV